jgi:hypothetical protein
MWALWGNLSYTWYGSDIGWSWQFQHIAWVTVKMESNVLFPNQGFSISVNKYIYVTNGISSDDGDSAFARILSLTRIFCPLPRLGDRERG